MPDWWPLVRAAKYLGVPPWELAVRSSYWTRVGNEAMSAAAAAEEALAQQQGSYDPSMPPGAVPG